MVPAVPTGPMVPTAPIAAQMGNCLINPSLQFLQQQPNAFLPNVFPPQQQQNLGIQGMVTNMLQNQHLKINNQQQQHQNQNLNLLLNGMPCQQQFFPNTGFPTNPLMIGGSANPSPTVMTVVPMGQGNFGQVPIRCSNMQGQGISCFPTDQNYIQPLPTVAGAHTLCNLILGPHCLVVNSLIKEEVVMSLVEVEAQVVGLKIGKGFPSLMNIYVS
uniref:Uncharacterized protein n=1 Tax=Ananas comosus var. bracteatus TaxID=296719 RepID=A0A6V7Q8H8_ANACO|nr:unnamed protein product [Ananas comosus var. bracteatus]